MKETPIYHRIISLVKVDIALATNDEAVSPAQLRDIMMQISPLFTRAGRAYYDRDPDNVIIGHDGISSPTYGVVSWQALADYYNDLSFTY